MIRPTKHNHPDKTLIYASYLMLEKLRSQRIVKYNELFTFIKSKIMNGEFLFLPALDFLYLLGLVEYRAKTDSIEYTEKST
ncbi:ABC-three component system middle component 8 [Acinetobacter oleivorans]|uniref:ABC-three component system middle component 8 n=1 Tax=Acinetobacter oleivorans TaxID=1148157 RepID=UPI00292A55D9|nr:ABC-three component system middle component 8 [Acinetobacter oleivorans]